MRAAACSHTVGRHRPVGQVLDLNVGYEPAILFRYPVLRNENLCLYSHFIPFYQKPRQWGCLGGSVG